MCQHHFIVTVFVFLTTRDLRLLNYFHTTFDIRLFFTAMNIECTCFFYLALALLCVNDSSTGIVIQTHVCGSLQCRLYHMCFSSRIIGNAGKTSISQEQCHVLEKNAHEIYAYYPYTSAVYNIFKDYACVKNFSFVWRPESINYKTVPSLQDELKMLFWRSHRDFYFLCIHYDQKESVKIFNAWICCFVNLRY